MSDDAFKARDEQLIASITIVLLAGYAIENHDRTLRIERTSDRRFIVRVEIDDVGLVMDRDDPFDDVRSAVAHYLDLCDPA